MKVFTLRSQRAPLETWESRRRSLLYSPDRLPCREGAFAVPVPSEVWVPIVTFIAGSLLAEWRARIDRRERAAHEERLQRERLNHELALRREDFRATRNARTEQFYRETLLSLDEAVSQLTRTVVPIYLQHPSGIDQSDRWWQIHVNDARDVRRHVARVTDDTLTSMIRDLLNTSFEIIHAESTTDHVAAMGRAQDWADDISVRIGELLIDPARPPSGPA